MLILRSRAAAPPIEPDEPTTFDRQRMGSMATLSNGDLTVSSPGANYHGALSTTTRGPGGKWYWEYTTSTTGFPWCWAGWASPNINLTAAPTTVEGNVVNAATNPIRFFPGGDGFFGTIPDGIWLGLALDADLGRWWVRTPEGWSDGRNSFTVLPSGGDPTTGFAGFPVRAFVQTAPFYLVGASGWSAQLTMRPGPLGTPPPAGFSWWDAPA